MIDRIDDRRRWPRFLFKRPLTCTVRVEGRGICVHRILDVGKGGIKLEGPPGGGTTVGSRIRILEVSEARYSMLEGKEGVVRWVRADNHCFGVMFDREFNEEGFSFFNSL